MSEIGLQKLLTNELMAQTGVKRCLSIRSYDPTRDQFVLRWFGGGKTVGLRVPRDVSHEEAFRYAKAALQEWQAATTGPDDDSVYERLKREAQAAGMHWMTTSYVSDERSSQPLDNG